MAAARTRDAVGPRILSQREARADQSGQDADRVGGRSRLAVRGAQPVPGQGPQDRSKLPVAQVCADRGERGPHPIRCSASPGR
jgi:hypothetical protein